MENGAAIALYGQNCTAGYGYGSALIRGADKGIVTDLVIHPHNGVHVNGRPVVTIIDAWRSGDNGYIKYSNNFLVQWGFVNIVVGESVSVTLHVPYNNRTYNIQVTSYNYSNQAKLYYAQDCGVGNMESTYFTILQSRDNAEAYWRNAFWLTQGFAE